MTDCRWARENFALLLYGELSFDAEERLESHLDACEECRAALAREKELHAAFDSVEVAPLPSLLRDCREDLRRHLMEAPLAGPAIAPDPPGRWWRRLIDAMMLRPSAGILRPAGAVALVAIGFFAARAMPAIGSGRAAMIPRYVEPVSDGRVQIVVDEMRQRVLTGPVDNQEIRGLLLAAAKDPSDPGLREETVEILNSRAQSADVRQTLIFTLRHDQNAAVRARAMNGLTPYVAEPDVRSALAQVLLADSNPDLRTEAIDLLTRGATPQLGMDRQLVGTLQELMQRGEQVDYVRERCRRVLQSVKASAETY